VILGKKRLGLIPQGGNSWLGGQYYLQSLFENLQLAGLDRSGWDVAQVGGTPGFFEKASYLPRGKKAPLSRLFWRYRCDMVFPYVPAHSFFPGGAKAIGWIYDLQHLEMPGMFDQGEIEHRNKYFQRTLDFSALTLTSSEHSQRLITRHWPGRSPNLEVFPFTAKVSWPEVQNAIGGETHFQGSFFLCPYQLWKHKNHRVLVEAARECVRRGRELKIYCTGEPSDFRHPDYPTALRNEVAAAGLSGTIEFLGRVSRRELLGLMARSRALLFPSLCEGWSTGLEEAKAMGKASLVSDIPTHREQNHAEARYFGPHNSAALAELLEAEYPAPDPGLIQKSIENYVILRQRAGKRFISLIQNL
jgi:glycosyltransferase involved in cell wall biosynthesis